jgi:peptidoglycan/xylan/chitin deacetylase (PgdA/CDA1 family)
MLKKFAAVALTVLLSSLPLCGVAHADTNAANLITNPSMEIVQDAATPQSWAPGSWGANTSTFSYLNTGHTGTQSVEVQTTQHTDGAANWYYADIPVVAGQVYEYSNWYQSNVDTEVDAEVTMSDGTTQYFYVSTVLASANWAQFKTTFTPPAGAKSIAVYQLLAKVGYLISDDYSLSAYTASPFNRALVSITLDDGWENQYVNAAPSMARNGLAGTYFVISGSLTDPAYMNGSQVQALYASGNEVGSHSVTHPDLTTLSPANLTAEMQQSQAALQSLIGAPVTDFAYPFGAYNSATIAEGQKYYASQRTINPGYNTKDSLDATQLKMYEVDSNITQAQVQAWVNGAIAEHAWLILCYHEIAAIPADPSDSQYTTQPADFAAEMAFIKSTGVTVATVSQALQEAESQVTTTPPTGKPGDFNADGAVNIFDMSILLSNWGKTGAAVSQGDVNADGTVDTLDLSAFLTIWSAQA